MVLRQYFLCYVVVNLLVLFTLHSRGNEHIKESSKTAVSLLTKGQEEENQDTDSSGEKKFGQPIDVDEDQTVTFINENAPEIKNQDISPEQELQMASMQDSSYQEDSDGETNGMSLDTIASRTLEQTSTSDIDQLVQDEDTNTFLTDEKLGNYSQGESDDILQRQFIAPLPNIHHIRRPVIIRHHEGFVREPHPYPATIHVRLPNQVNVLPKMYNVHHYSPHYYPVHYRKQLGVPVPYYVPMKPGPDVQDTHLHVYHPGRY